MRLLILSASAGAGHTRAAQALEAAAREIPGVEAEHWDVLAHVDRLYRKAYAAGYLAMVDRAPELWGAFYRASDRKPPRGLKERLVHAFDRIEFAGFRDAVQMFRPDAVVATHFLPAQVFAPARRRGRARFRFGLVVTDFDVHAFWVQPGADLTCVATDELRAVLVDRGVPSDRVVATGIPILPAFSVPNDRRMIRAALGIRDEKPAILVMGGGSGVGSMLDAVTAARDAGNVHVLAVAGRNPALERRLRTLAPPAGGTLTAFGFVSNVHELMAAADLAVTKSGGLTTSECLASGLPMVVRDPIPGQEERNCDYVLEAGAGVRTHGTASLRYKLGALLADPARLARMKGAARGAARPRAAREILARLLGTGAPA
jgi:processive 1,2-diacylglycerol beta-glucosyltransferase